MSGAELRKAAETLRERANAADSAPWEVTGKAGSPWDDLVVTDASNGITADCDTSNDNATYIATMHPGVGMALADWLDAETEHVASHECEARCAYPEGSPRCRAALTLARLVNGGAS